MQLGKNATTTEFPLEKGHAQGDSPSPILNNMAAQIIIFKIKLNPTDRKNKKWQRRFASKSYPPELL